MKEVTIEMVTALLFASLATGTHVTKAGILMLINTSPEPFSNWFASVVEDVAVVVGVWTSINQPVLFLIMLGLFVILMIRLLPKMWLGTKRFFWFILC